VTERDGESMLQLDQNQMDAWLVYGTWALALFTLVLVLATWRGMVWQRRAAIRPVVRFRSDYEKIPSVQGSDKINLVNVGLGVALNVRACHRVGRGSFSECEYTESIDRGPRQEHPPADKWQEALRNDCPKEIWILYEDSEGVTYCSYYRRDGSKTRPVTRVWMKRWWTTYYLQGKDCPRPRCAVCRARLL